MERKGRYWVVLGLVGWVAVALFGLLSDQYNGWYMGLMAAQQLVFVICGGLGTDWTRFARPSVTAVAQGVLLGVGLYLINTVTMSIAVGALELLGAQQALQWVFAERSAMEALVTSGSPKAALTAFLLVVVAAPFGEELFFRGALLGALVETQGRKKGLVLASLVFAALHLYIIRFVPIMVAGLYLGLIVLRTRSLAAAVTAHGVANCLTFFVLLAAL
ncbi:MAG: CPBP family intramembrane glutamic endopeptidase [Limnochordia bacterium]